MMFLDAYDLFKNRGEGRYFKDCFVMNVELKETVINLLNLDHFFPMYNLIFREDMYIIFILKS